MHLHACCSDLLQRLVSRSRTSFFMEHCSTARVENIKSFFALEMLWSLRASPHLYLSILSSQISSLSFAKLVVDFNKKRPTSFAVDAKNSFHKCFVRSGAKTSNKPNNGPNRPLLAVANDWTMLVDFDHKNIVFPPNICATDQRPDIVLWSRMSREVILLELTCCAEEGIEAAKSRKEVRYHELVESINLAHSWKAQLLTIEVGARGLIGGSTFRAFLKLGFSLQGARNLTKTLSTVVARCSYAVYLAHKSHAWTHNLDLVIAETASGSDETAAFLPGSNVEKRK